MTDPLFDQLQAALGAQNVIKRELGGGGMSRVFLVEEQGLHRMTVVKVLPPEMSVELSVARFDREIKLLARLQHPHIVSLITAGNAAGVPYYTMPFVEGESLHQRMQRTGELTISESVRLLREIASALSYAHEHGVVHRDIKPDNILITGGIALVADFGVAKALLESSTIGQRPSTAAGMSVGTPAYMSPEQASADPTIDQRADLYSFGAVAYEMLTGRAPFTARTTQALLAAHVVETPEPITKRRASIPADLAALIMSCLEKRPADRPQSANEIIQALDALQLSSNGSMAYRASGDNGAVGSSWRLRGRVVAAALVCALLAAAGVWYARGKRATIAVSTSNRVLIAPFLNLTNDPKLAHIGALAAGRLAMTMAQAGFDVVPYETVALALRDTIVDRSKQLRLLAAATRAKWVVTGTILLEQDSLHISTAIRVGGADSVAQALAEKRGYWSNAVAVIDAIGGQLQVALKPRIATPILPTGFRVATPDAYKEFLEGFELFALSGDIYGSRPHFKRAIELDTSMVQAYQLLGRQFINGGEFASADSVLNRITALNLPMTPTEQLHLNYQRADIDGNIDGMIKSTRALVALDSNALSLYLYGESQLYLLRTTDATEAMRAAVPTFVVMGGQALLGLELTLAKSLHLDNRNAEALQLLKTHEKDYRGEANLRGAMLREAIGMKDTVVALAILDSMLTENLISEPASAVSWLITGIEEFRVHGDNRMSQRVAQNVAQRIRATPAAVTYPSALFDQGTIFMLAGLPDSAVFRFETALARSKRIEPAGYLALALAQIGDTARARQIADSLGSLRQPFLRGLNTYWRALILAALGDREIALQLLRQSVTQGRTMDQWHCVPELNVLRGYPAFDQLLRPRK